MSFDPIPPDHPLTEAARAVNMVAEERGMEATIDWLDVGCTPSQFAYLAHQRAIRAFAASYFGHNMGSDPARDEQVAKAVLLSPEWRQFQLLALGCYMDGMAIGWKGREIAERDS